MKKTLRKSLLAIAGALLCTQTLGAVPENFNLEGTIGSHTSINVRNLTAGTKVIFTDVTPSNFNNGFINSNNAIRLNNIVSNVPVFVLIANKGWTLPAGYDTTNGPKKAAGTDSEFLIKVDAGSVTASSGAIGVENGYDAAYIAVTDTPGQFLKLGEVTGGGVRKGMAGGVCDIDGRVLLDAAYDIPGTYSLALEITVSAQP